MTNLDQLFQSALQHHQAGRLAEAEQLYRQLLAYQPRHADGLNLLGVLAAQTGRHDIAVNLIKQAIALRPNFPEAQNNLGVSLVKIGQLNDAIACYRQAIALNPDNPNARNNLGIALIEVGQVDEAIASCERAIALKPQFPDAYCNLGNALKKKRRLHEAIAAYRKAIDLQPDLANAHNNLGSALADIGQQPEAIAAYRQAIALKPDYPEAYTNLGNALKESGKLDEAITAHRCAIAMKPDLAEAYTNLGDALLIAGEPDEAIAAHRCAIAMKPDLAEAYTNLGNALKEMAQLNEAIACYRRAVLLNPNSSEAHSNLLFTLNYHPGFPASAIAAEARVWNERHAEPLRRFIQPHSNSRDPNRRLRIGYVSPDFWAQAESYFVVPLFEAHDQSQYEIHAYASVIRPDSVTDRLHRSVSKWHDVLALDNKKLAERIRRDGIDILVDLTMHMASNRLPLFAHKPAPIQVTWLAYPGSTGLDTIDYRITDAHMDPLSTDPKIYSETSVRLPDSWCCYDPMSTLPPAPVATPQWGNFIRFGSLNNFCKLNEPLLRLWARVLADVPESRLFLLADQGSHRDDLRRTLERLGIDGDRVEFCGKSPRTDYLRLYDAIDIALDPLPYNGITTTLDALWMGVPVISLTGKTAAGRAGLSLLSTIGLPELVAQTSEQFVQIACGLAQDASRLAELRSTMRQRLLQSPLMDYPRFARDMESAYRHMWTRWCLAQ